MASTLMLDIGGVFYRGWPADDFWPRWSLRTGLDRSELEEWLSSSEDARLARVGHISAAEYYDRASRRHGADPNTFKALVEEAFLSDFNTELAGFVRSLNDRGVRVWALTNSLSPEAVWMSRPDIGSLFVGVISSCEYGLAKPDPKIFALAARRAGVAPHDIIFVDDILSHVQAARDAGFAAIQFDCTRNLTADLARRFSGQTPI